jgi:putative flippase GtrA
MCLRVDSRTIGECCRYSLAGLVNTSVGYAIIFGGMALGFSAYFSNLAGYSTGLLVSFYLSKNFVFSVKGDSGRQMTRFLMCFALAYLVNLAVLHLILLTGGSDVAGQLIAGVSYLLIMFTLSRLWIFKK